MYPKQGNLPSPLATESELDALGDVFDAGDVNETPFNVFIGHNLGHRVFVMSVPFRKFHDISEVANDRESGPVAQRPLDANHAKRLAGYMLKGLVSAARIRREILKKPVPESFEKILKVLGDQPYFSLQPIVCNIRDVEPGGSGSRGIRSARLETPSGETACFRVFLSERHILWVVDGQHRRKASNYVMEFLDIVRASGKYPARAPVLHPSKGKEVTEDEMLVWNEAFEAARGYATLTLEVHLGLDAEQERQLFHDLNRLGKRVDPSLALQFDSSNPVIHFVKGCLVAEMGIQVSDKEPKDWSEDTGAIAMKDVVAVNAIAFLNKGNVSGATPAVVEPRQGEVRRLWESITEAPHFGEPQAKEKTVLAQSVVMKALAKLTYDLNFSNRRPENGAELYAEMLNRLSDVDFSHSNPMWRYYEMDGEERDAQGLSSLADYLPEDAGEARDLGAKIGEHFRFGAKHNDIFPIIGDMIRWSIGLPSRRS